MDVGKLPLNRQGMDLDIIWTGSEHFPIDVDIEPGQSTVEATLRKTSKMGKLTVDEDPKTGECSGFSWILKVGCRHESSTLVARVVLGDCSFDRGAGV